MKDGSKKLGLFDLISIGVGSVIGAGIFSMLSTGISYTGRSVAMALVMAIVLTVLQQVRNIFSASMFSLEGGVYAQSALVLPDIFTGMTAIIFLFSNLTFSVFGISLSGYLTQLIPVLAPFRIPLAVLILTAFFLASYKGVRFLSNIQNVMTICMYAALLLFVVFGIGKVVPGGFEGESYFSNGPMGFLMAMAIMSFTCTGSTNVINLSGEAKNPKRNIPAALLLTAGICALLYFLLGYVAAGVLPYEQSSTMSLSEIAQNILPSGLYVFFIVGGAMFALATSLLGNIAALSAPIVSASVDGWLPAVFSKKTKNGFPYVTMILMWVIAVIPAIFDASLDTIVSFIIVPGSVMTLMANVLSYGLPKRYPEAWENCALRCPHWIYNVLITLSIVACAVTALFSLLTLNLVGVIGNVILTLGMIFYTKYRIKKGYVKIVSTQDSEQKA